MNAPQPAIPALMPPPAGGDDELHLLDLLDVVLDHRWIIAAATVIAATLGGLYAFLSAPVYETDVLIQVEDSKSGGAGSLLGEAASLFEIRSPATAEMEILRSRLVVGQAVHNLQLDLDVSPRFTPIVGRWLAGRATEPSEPGVLGFRGFVSGNEGLRVASFDVPTAQEGKRFTVRLAANGYALVGPEGEALGDGSYGQPLEFTMHGAKGRLLVVDAVGKPGAEFRLVRSSQLAVVGQLQGKLAIAEQGRQSGVIRASLQGTDRAQIARTLNEIGSLYVRQNVERKSAEAERSLSFLGTLLPQLRQQLDDSEKKFNDFRNRSGTFDLGEEAKAALEQGIKLQTNLLELQQKRRELETGFTAEHPTVQALDRQIRAINAELTALGGKTKSLPNLEQDLLRLTRDTKVNAEIYANLLNSFQQLRLVKEGKVGNVRVVDVAAVPEGPIKPKRGLVIALATLLGLFGGVALAFVRNSMRHGIEDPSEVEERAGLHVFSTVPHSAAQLTQARDIKAKRPGTHLLALSAPDDPAIEALRSLRTALQFALLETGSKVVLITGPTPGIGKTFTSANFAAVLGAAGKRVLLVDADLRKGHLNQYFGLARERGLSEVVSGSLTLDQALHRGAAPGVDFLSTGTLPPNPSELLMTTAARELVQQAADAYDLVIIDTPPVLAASDTAILAPLAGAVFLVARAEITTVGELQESAKRLAQSGAQARGVIFNGLNVSKRRYGYTAGKYGYRYAAYRY